MKSIQERADEFRNRFSKLFKTHAMEAESTTAHLSVFERQDLMAAEALTEIMPLLEENDRLVKTVTTLQDQQILTSRKIDVLKKWIETEKATGARNLARLQHDIEQMRLAAARGELLSAQLDLALAEHGYDYPKGVEGWKDLLSHHDDLKDVAELRKDALELIKSALSPEKPCRLEEVVTSLHKIIETWENDENDR